MTRPTRARATAFAKVTLSLRVLGKRPDGFHDLDALAVSIGQPQDSLEAAVISEPGVRLDVVGEDTLPPDGDENLAAQAADRVLQRAGRQALGVHLTLRKRIPVGGGLGGGSADAAAALVAVRHLMELELDDAALFELAAGIGSDVPFCLRGGAARMRGRGERLEPVAIPLGLPLLIAVPPFGLATSDVYRTWDELGGRPSTRIVPPPPALDSLVSGLVNDLEPAAEALEPRLVEFRQQVEEVAGRPAVLAGSGSSYVVPVDPDGRRLGDLAAELGQRLRRPVIGAATVSRGVRLET
ncbi:MAG: 4-(cytidine 5'-diphospho)-2-C-methyl-D-erythritol kinase [Actinobacteria bacterium]|nr:4-(cytidine 5'-diphospho)-2-C-methyl-D-erythritol kinase [Actinomycetota bacterium]